MSDLEAMIQNAVERFMGSRVTEKYGVVTSYDPQKHTAKVMIQPDNFESGWLRVSEGHIGSGWGIVSGLQVGDQVKVSVAQGDINNGSIAGRVHSDQDQPPVAQSGEIVIQHTSGAKIMMAADGSVSVHSSGPLAITGATVSING